MHMLLDSSHKWLILDENDKSNVTADMTDSVPLNFSIIETNGSTEILNVVQELNISVDADIVLATKKGKFNVTKFYFRP